MMPAKKPPLARSKLPVRLFWNWFAAEGEQGYKEGRMRFEICDKNPGIKASLFWGKEGQLTLYLGTNTHPWGKVYFFRG